MILCVGEILADMIGSNNGNAFCYERKAGGAPFNVACAAKKLGSAVGFVGAVGDDVIGEYLIGFARGRGFDYTIIDKNNSANTTLAFVDINADGERSFSFYRKNTADYLLPQVSDEMLKKSDIVHIGSLMLSEEAGRKAASELCERARKEGKLVSFDVNFRSDIYRDTESAVKIYKQVMKFADILKFSEDEAEIFGWEYVESLTDKLVCVSLGGKGSMWRYGGESETVPSVRVTPVDTTGAGDAFYGGVLSGLDGLRKKNWTKQKLNEIFGFANVCGALNTLCKGAIEGLPDKADVMKKMRAE